MTLPRALFLHLPLVLALAPSPAAAHGVLDLHRSRGVRAHLAEGRLEEAREAARLALEHAPNDGELLMLAAETLARLGAKDEALWHALRGAQTSPGSETLWRSSAGWVASIDPLAEEREPLWRQLAERRLELARGFEKRGHYAVAWDLARTLEGTSAAASAAALIQRLKSRPAALDALLASGLELEFDHRQRAARSPAPSALDRGPARSWQQAEEVKSANYLVRTNLGSDYAKRISAAMEQMGSFYREVFRYRERGGAIRRCTIHVYATRAQFDAAHPSLPPTLRGFYTPESNFVATYDPRDDGRAETELWATLFHEAAHQFTALSSKSLIPSWLNEGTATYFEGAQLLASGRVRTNLIPDHRIRSLWHARTMDAGPARVSLDAVVRYFAPTSYPEEYYPFGWGLVYFLHNYENERSERIYLEHYHAFWGAYRAGEKHSVFERFLRHFVQGPADPAVTNFEEFERRFWDWIEARYQLHVAGPEGAGAWIARAQIQAANGKHEQALESFGLALSKQPEETRAMRGIALSALALGRSDLALFHLHRAERALGDPQKALSEPQRAQQLAEVRELQLVADREFAQLLRQRTMADEVEAMALARRYSERGFPRTACWLLHGVEPILGPSVERTALANEIAAAHGVDMRLWQRVQLDEDLGGWSFHGDGAWTARGGVLAAKVESPALCAAAFPSQWDDPWTLEFRVRLDGGATGGHGSGGVVVSNREWSRGLVLLVGADGAIYAGALGPGELSMERLGRADRDGEGFHGIGVERTEQGIAVVSNGRRLGAVPLVSLGEEEQVALTARAGTAEFADLRALCSGTAAGPVPGPAPRGVGGSNR